MFAMVCRGGSSLEVALNRPGMCGDLLVWFFASYLAVVSLTTHRWHRSKWRLFGRALDAPATWEIAPWPAPPKPGARSRASRWSGKRGREPLLHSCRETG